MKKIFADSLKKFCSENAEVGGKFLNDYSYSLAYWKAGDILVENALTLNQDTRNHLFYPICFTYRHFIELTLKQLIIYAEIFYKKTELLGYEFKKYKEPLEDLKTIHSLEKLLSRLINILECVSENKFNKKIKKSILKFHYLDPSGQKFRYPITTKNQKSFSERHNFNISLIKEEVNKIALYFMGIDSYLYLTTNLADNIIGKNL